MTAAAPPVAGTQPTSFLDPSVLARIGNLELLARTVVEGFINGLHKSPHLGASTDFAQHRGYMPGDDIRRIDWRLWARSDRYYLKEFEARSEEHTSELQSQSNLVCRLLLEKKKKKHKYNKYQNI